MNALGTVVLPCTNCAASTRTVNFVASSPMRVRIVGLQYTTGAPPATVNNPPRAIDFTLTASWLRRAYPTGNLISSQLTVASANAFPFTCNAANAELTTLRNNEIAAGTSDNRTHYVALVSNAGGFMRGCAPIPGTVASGPSGATTGGLIPVNATGDPDNSFADWYAGHELGHSYNRLHPGFCNGNSSDDGSFPNPNGQISDNAGTFTGLDFGDAGNGIAMVALPGASTFDIMTYCNQRQWMSAYAYEGIRGRLNAENPAGTGAPGGGAPTAMVARRTTPCHCALDIQPSRRLPPAIQIARKTPPRSYLALRAEPSPPSAAYKEALVPPESRNPPDTTPVPAERFPAEIVYYEYPATPLPDPAPLPPAERMQNGDLVSIVAEVNVTRNAAVFYYVSRVNRGQVAVEVNDSRAMIRMRDSAGRLLGEHPVLVRQFSDREPGEDQTALIDATLPLKRGVRVIELSLGDTVVATRHVSPRAPRVTALSRVRSDTPGQERPDSGVELTWTATDADGDSLTYTVEVMNERETWETVAIRLPVTRLTVMPSMLQDRRALRVRVTANDGFNNSLPYGLRLDSSGAKRKQ